MRSLLLDLKISILDKVDAAETGDVGESGVANALKDYNRWRREERGVRHLGIVRHIPETELLTILAPIDGAKALRQGWSGALSVMAAGSPARQAEANGIRTTVAPSFKLDSAETSAKAFFIVVLGPDALTKRMKEKLCPFTEGVHKERLNAPLDSVLRESPLLRDIIHELSKKQFPSIAFMTDGEPYKEWSGNIAPIKDEPFCMRRVLNGSSVSAALGTLRGHAPVSACVARRAQAFQIALATMALGGQMYAIALEEGPRQASDSKQEAQGSKHVDYIAKVKTGSWLGEAAFVVEKTNAVLVSTSVTEVCLQDRIRYREDGHVSSNTLIVSLATHGLREVQQAVELKRTTFWDENGDERPALDVLESFKKNFHTVSEAARQL